MLALVTLAAVAFLLALRAHDGDAGGETPPAAIAAGAPSHSLAELHAADFVSIFVYDGNGGVSSFMVGGGTGDFARLAGAIAGAQPVDAGKDESFADLLVFSFGNNDTVEIEYSASRGLLSFNGVRYRPADALTPLIDSVEKKLK